MRLTNALKLEVLMCAAYEVCRHAKEEYVQCAMETYASRPRKERREAERVFRESFSNLHRMLYQFTEVVERTNPEFFDEMLDKVMETLNKNIE